MQSVKCDDCHTPKHITDKHVPASSCWKLHELLRCTETRILLVCNYVKTGGVVEGALKLAS